jgi:hypothetical protein
LLVPARIGRVLLFRGFGLAALLALGLLVATSASGAQKSQRRAETFYTGLGFDTCKAPPLETMDAWLASPYRAIGIYLGGSNRACPDGNLTPSWITSARSMGWNLLPLWVGPQAPCVTQKGLQPIGSDSADSEGRAEADDAVTRAGYFGIGAGYPIYYDMEGYKPTASCTQTVQTFVAAWVKELHARGYVAGVYGSANSTIRDLVSMLESGSELAPDDVWIARWNGVEQVFGDPVVPDYYWSDHQRVHQYRGGHKESYGGVTLNIDSNYVDGAIVEAAATLPPGSPLGSVPTPDGLATVSWWEGAFEDPENTTVSLASSSIPSPLPGFATPASVLQLQALDMASVPIPSFGTLLDIHVGTPPPGVVVAFSSDGQTWKSIQRLSGPSLPLGSSYGYMVGTDGSLDIYTLVPGYFALLQDISPPLPPASLTARLRRRTITLKWLAATDNSGVVSSYAITLGGKTVQTIDSGDARTVTLSKFERSGPSIYRVKAIDGAGLASRGSRYVKVVARSRPKSAPRAIPRWAFPTLTWQANGKKGKRPKGAPRKLPSWYWLWSTWKLSPYRIAG